MCCCTLKLLVVMGYYYKDLISWGDRNCKVTRMIVASDSPLHLKWKMGLYLLGCFHHIFVLFLIKFLKEIRTDRKIDQFNETMNDRTHNFLQLLIKLIKKKRYWQEVANGQISFHNITPDTIWQYDSTCLSCIRAQHEIFLVAKLAH